MNFLAFQCEKHTLKKPFCIIFMPKKPCLKFCNINFWIGNDPSPPIRNFSKNSSVLEGGCFPNYGWVLGGQFKRISSYLWLGGKKCSRFVQILRWIESIFAKVGCQCIKISMPGPLSRVACSQTHLLV